MNYGQSIDIGQNDPSTQQADQDLNNPEDQWLRLQEDGLHGDVCWGGGRGLCGWGRGQWGVDSSLERDGVFILSHGP